MNPLLTHSGTQLARMIREGDITSRALVEAHIAHIEKVNPTLNAVVDDRFEEARFESDTADKQLRETGPDDLPPFHGVPCTIKECFALTDMPQTAGLVSRKGTRARKDAVTVARLRAAGALPLGVTNVSELCMWMESSNRVYGRTNNPYDPSRIVGGSSGGEGAIIGAGGSPFGLGSDIGGSIRMPAFFNGVFGHKPTGGMVPGSGQYPVAEPGALRFLTTGPLCRKAEDLMPLLRVLAGPDGEDTGCEAFELGDPEDVDLSTLRVLNVTSNGAFRVSPDLQDIQKRVATHLEGNGANLQEDSFSQLKNSFDIWSSMLGASATRSSFRNMLGLQKKRQLLWQLFRWSMGRSPFTLPALILGLVENLDKRSPERAERFILQGQTLRQTLLDAIGPNGVMLYPSYTRPAPLHHKPLFPPFHWVYTGIVNVMEFPATQVPLGLNADGLPLGIQVIAAPGNDHLTIAVAMELERAFGGWVPPPEPKA